MAETRPRCRCKLMTCTHQPGECDRFAADSEFLLCSECRDAKIKALEDEIAEIDAEIEQTKIALVALQTGMSPEGDLEDEELLRLDTKRKKVASQLKQLKKVNAMRPGLEEWFKKETAELHDKKIPYAVRLLQWRRLVQAQEGVVRTYTDGTIVSSINPEDVKDANEYLERLKKITISP